MEHPVPPPNSGYPPPPPPPSAYPVYEQYTLYRQPVQQRRGLALGRLNLQPMTLVDILDRTIWLYRRNVVTFLLIVAIIEIPVAIITSVLTISSNLYSLPGLSGSFGSTSTARDSNPLSGVNWIALGIVYLLAITRVVFLRNIEVAALTGAIAAALSGERPSVRSAYRGIIRSVIALTASGFLLAFATMLLVIVCVVLFGAALIGLGAFIGILGSGGGNAGAAQAGAVLIVIFTILAIPILFLVAFLPLIYVYVRFAFAPQAIVIEGCGPIEGLQRSWHLVKGAWWRSCGILALLYLLQFFLVSGPASMSQFGTFILAINNPQLAGLISELISTTLYIIFTPVSMAGMTLLYFDLRVRKEGLDLEYMVRDLEAAAQPGSTQAS